MRTRCPVCSTVFRVTSEQLRLRAGKVRCGNCQTVFNAFDEMVSEPNEPLLDRHIENEAQSSEDLGSPETAALGGEQESGNSEIEPVVEPDSGLTVHLDIDPDLASGHEPEVHATDGSETVPEDGQESVLEPSMDAGQGASEVVGDDVPAEMEPVVEEAEVAPGVEEPALVQAPLAEPLLESPEESTQAARQAGLVAARELNDSSSFNRWSAGTLASDGLGGFDGESTHRAVWPFVVVGALLLVGLLGQILYFFRSDIVLRFPGTAGLYEFATVDIPLPRNAALVSIETSDLQSDNARGLFVLQAVLKNRAVYAQDWPALELSLTDSNDSVVSRRVMFAADYLPPGTTSDSFPANGEIPVKLWIEAKESGASGYRLYIFYP
ncbi:MAG: zinc-ribbon domain-containing protein [Dechloromonas sp.]|nr:zinc-ribbon domain-containing protein [Dechloromonas sp.]